MTNSPKPHSKRLLWAVLYTASALTPAIALAQQLSEESETVALEPIVIAPRLWQEAATGVPGTAHVKMRDGLGASVHRPQGANLGDVTADSPGITFQHSNADERLVIRGISAYPNSLTDPVGVQVNGVALPLGTVQAPTLFALDRATVLPGPQGAHYGRNSEAGLVAIELIRPGDLRGGKVSVGLSRHGGKTGTLLLGGNLASGTSALIGLDLGQSDGQITNPVTGKTDGGAQERVTGLLGFAHETDGGTRIELTTILEDEDGGKEQFRYSDGAFVTGRFQSNYNDASTEQRKSHLTSLRITKDFEGFTFTSITGLTGYDRDFTLDFDTAPLPLGVTVLDLEDDMLSQEFRLASQEDADGRLSWSAGLHVYRQNTAVDFNLGSFAVDRHTEIEQTGASLYGFAEYAVTDRLRLGAGGRLDYQDSKGVQSLTSPLGSATYGSANDSLTFLPKLTAAYDLSDDAMLYASLSRGYLAGGYNYNFASNAANFTFDPEYSTALEIGGRFSWGVSSLAAAAHYTEVRDKQIAEVVPGGAQRITNAAKVKSYGLDLTFETQLRGGLRLSASTGLIQAEATAFETAVFGPSGPMPVNYSGNDLPYAPRSTYAIGLEYDTGEGLFGGVQLNGTGGYFFDAANRLRQPGFATVDAQIGWRRGDLTLTLWAANLFDKAYQTAALSTARGTLVEDGPGRTIGFSLSRAW